MSVISPSSYLSGSADRSRFSEIAIIFGVAFTP